MAVLPRWTSAPGCAFIGRTIPKDRAAAKGSKTDHRCRYVQTQHALRSSAGAERVRDRGRIGLLASPGSTATTTRRAGSGGGIRSPYIPRWSVFLSLAAARAATPNLLSLPLGHASMSMARCSVSASFYAWGPPLAKLVRLGGVGAEAASFNAPANQGTAAPVRTRATSQGAPCGSGVAAQRLPSFPGSTLVGCARSSSIGASPRRVGASGSANASTCLRLDCTRVWQRAASMLLRIGTMPDSQEVLRDAGLIFESCSCTACGHQLPLSKRPSTNVRPHECVAGWDPLSSRTSLSAGPTS